MDNDLFRISIW